MASTTPSEPLELVEQDLAARLKGVAWASPAMAKAINSYLGGMLRRAGVGLALTVTPLAADMQGLDLPNTMLRLGAIQKLDQEERQALFRRAWTTGNGEAPEGEHGYRHWVTEILLEASHRLRKSAS